MKLIFNWILYKSNDVFTRFSIQYYLYQKLILWHSAPAENIQINYQY